MMQIDQAVERFILQA